MARTTESPAAVPRTAPIVSTRTTGSPAALVGRLAFRQLVRGAIVWGAVFALTLAASVFAYELTYGTAAERAELLRGIGSNSGIRALFGPARELDTVTGFTAWRTLSLLPLVAGVWGLLVATRLLRGEEDRGRWETILAGPLGRARATIATFAAIGAGTGVLFALTTGAIVLTAAVQGGIPVGGGLWLALALCIAAPAFAAVGALTAQIAPTRRAAAALAGAVFGAAYLVRVAADGSSSLGWLRWLTPLGWIEEMRPLTGARPIALLPLLAWIAVLVAASAWIARRRDLGAAVLARRDERPPRHAGLRSAASFSLRESLGGLVGWALAMALTGLIFGFVSKAVADLARTSAGLREHVRSTTSAPIDIASARGYLALVFIFLAVALSLYAASHATAAREEEATGRLDTLLGQPVTRRRWLAGCVLVAATCVAVVALVTGLAAWAGAAAGGAEAGLGDLLKASLNALPVVALFLGLSVLGFAVAPRHTGAIGFGLVGFAYLWEQTGAIVRAPEWVLSISPFHWLALVPAEPFDVAASLAMLAAGAAAALAGIELFQRRDLVSA